MAAANGGNFAISDAANKKSSVSSKEDQASRAHSTDDYDHAATATARTDSLETSDVAVRPFDYAPDSTLANGKPLLRRNSVVLRVQLQMLFFSDKLKSERVFLAKKLVKIYLIMFVFVLAVFSIYWGSFFKRSRYFKNLKFLVVNEDDSILDGIEPYIGNTIQGFMKAAPHLGQWHIYNSTEFRDMAGSSNVRQEIIRLIHHQSYWGAVFIKPNATYNLYQALSSGNTLYSAANNTVETIFETGRDFQNMKTIMQSVWTINSQWQDAQSLVMTKILSHVPSFNSSIASILATPVPFVSTDLIPYTNPVLIAPSQVGLIYMVILTFFQFNFMSEVHTYVAKLGLRPILFVIYRVSASVFAFFWLSFVFSLVSLAFQIDFTVTFGHSGFLVYWMISFTTMWCVGMANEIAAMLLITVYPPLLGCWILFWVIINISGTFLPIALLPKFYRYGYAMPIHNSNELNKVVLFNTYKGTMGRHFGILVAWMVILTLALPPTARYFGMTMKRKAQEAKEREAAEKEMEARIQSGDA